VPDIRALSSEVHRNLRVITKRGAEYGENTHFVPVVADELRSLVLEYPVILLKDKESERFNLCAMLGFEHNENLFLDGDLWDATYVPVHIRRQPFSLTYTAKKDDGKPDPSSYIISVDVGSNRVQADEGERLFDEDGNQTEFLKELSGMLAGIGTATASTEAFVSALATHDLIEPANLDVQFASGETKRFEGIYTVSDETLNKIEGDVLADLYKQGYLQAAWLILASAGNVQKLLLRKTLRDGVTSQV
jgi:hypothetical protein